MKIYNIIFLFLLGFAFAQQENPCIVEKNARFTIISPECIRLEYSKTGEFVDLPSLFAVNRSALSSEFSVERFVAEDRTSWRIKTKRIEMTYKPDGLVFHPGNIVAEISCGVEKFVWTPGKQSSRNLGGTVRTLDQARGPIPLDDGVLSRDGWYLLDDSRRPLLTKDWVIQRPPTAGIDWYIFAYGLDYASGLKALTTIGGKVPMPRKYALGSWYSRYWPYSSEEYRQIVKEYKDNDFPLDIMVLDMDWHKDGWTGWSWNRELLPDAENLLTWLHKQNLAVTLNLHPASGVQRHEDMYEAFMKDMDATDKKPLLFDSSNQKYMTTLFHHTHTPLEKAGVDFWWLDWQQFEPSLGNPELKNLEWLNHCYFERSKQNGMRGLSFSRWGGWGDHKHPIHFSGDATSIWPMLEFEVPFTSVAGNVGCFFWSHDIGGHYGGLDPETNTRWIQFGACTAALRLHSTRDATMDKRPWLIKEPHVSAMRRAFHLRSILMPYIYSSVWQSCKESIPLTRPMYIEYPNVEIAYHSQQQYLWGDAFLVAPITKAGTGEYMVANQRVWFPAGVWYNWFTGERHAHIGENFTNVWADISEFPLYARGGMPIPMQPYTDRMSQLPLTHVIVRVYPGPNASSTLYEDDGISLDYEKGKYAITQLSYKQDSSTQELTIHPCEGTYDNQPQQRSYTIEFGDNLSEEIGKVFVNGQAWDFQTNDKEAICRVEIPSISIQKTITIQVQWKKISVLHGIQQAMPTLQRWQKMTAKLASVQGENTSLQAMLVELEKWPCQDRQNILSFLSEISIHRESPEIVHLVANAGIPTNKIQIVVKDFMGNTPEVIASHMIDMVQGSRMLEIPEPMRSVFGLPTRRDMEISFMMDEQEIKLIETLDARDACLPECLLIGPFDFDRNKKIQDYPHEIETTTLYPLPEKFIGKDKKLVYWQKAVCQPNSEIDMGKYIGGEDCIAYGLVYLISEQEQPATFYFNSDDGIEVWLNGKNIHSHNVLRSSIHVPDECTGTLHIGRNTLLVKISQGMGGWCFKTHISTQIPIQYTIE